MKPKRVAQRRIVLVATATVALGGAAVVARCLRASHLPAHIEVEEVVAELAPPLPPLARVEGRAGSRVRAGTLQPGDALGGGGRRQSLIASPPSRVSFHLEVPARASLRFAFGVEGRKRRERGRSGVRFRVRVGGHELFTRVVNPAATRHDRRWIEGEVDLGPYTGRSVELALETEAERDGLPLAGTPAWSHVRVVRIRARDRQLASPAAPSVLVLLVDTLRADRLGCYGATPTTSPTLDALAARGLLFEQAVSQSSWTMPSVASLFSGLHPRSHGALGDRRSLRSPGAKRQPGAAFLADQVVTWAEEARGAGITTFGVSSNPLVSRATNLAQGFETFIELPWDPEGKSWPRAAEVNHAFLGWLRANRAYRFVAYLHYMEPHDPYTPPPALTPAAPPDIRPVLARGRVDGSAKRINWHAGRPLSPAEIAYLKRLYDGEIRAWDDALAELLRGLDELGTRRSTVVVITSDHGEEFQEHGRLKHGSHLYEESIRVPLVIAGPGIGTGRRREPVQGIDLFPTLAGLLGLEAPRGLPGRNLLAPAGASRPALVETRNGISPDGKPMEVVALRTARWKLIESPAIGRVELYDLAHDPGERTDLRGTAPEGAVLHEALAHFAAAPPPAPPGHRDPAIIEKLRALGYVE